MRKEWAEIIFLPLHLIILKLFIGVFKGGGIKRINSHRLPKSFRNPNLRQ